MVILKNYVVSLLVALSLGWTIYMIYPSYIEFNKTQNELYILEKDLLKQQKINERFLKINHKLKTDPRMIERIAREKFGWSKSGEKIYNFNHLRKIDVKE